MILRVPDYYETFSCIADQCQDSCCVGWEIDIDEDTFSYYRNVEGTFGDRLRQNMVPLKDEEGYSFALKSHGRCPFLNDSNLCDICIELGEEALSEVCTEYPRFSLYYGNTLQKCLSISCEEVDRILFTRNSKVQFVDRSLPGEEDYELEEWEEAGFSFFERLQDLCIRLLQNREFSMWDRMEKLLAFLTIVQSFLDISEEEELVPAKAEELYGIFEVQEKETFKEERDFPLRSDYKSFEQSLAMFEKMEVLDHHWTEKKKELREAFTEENYQPELEKLLTYLNLHKESYDQKEGAYFFGEQDYEQLVVYFFFRYFMQSVYDFNVLSKGRLAVEFTLFLRDMDLLTFMKKGKVSLQDRIYNVKVFSKEVEHCEENVKFAEENIAIF